MLNEVILMSMKRKMIQRISALLNLYGMITLFMCILFAGSVVADGSSFSSFTKTTTINTLCEVINELQTIQVDNPLQCSVQCTGNINCRRFRYCSSDSTCVLYVDGTHCEMINVPTGCSCYRKVIGCRDSGCTCPLGYYGNNCESIVQDCKEAHDRNIGGTVLTDPALVYIRPTTTHRPKEVACNLGHGGGLIIMSRSESCYSDTFNRSMKEYEHGFGFARWNRWVGLKTVMAVLEARKSTIFQLQVMLFDSEYTLCMSYYYDFKIGSKSTGYKLTYVAFSPGSFKTCGDAFDNQRGSRFSTYDDDTTPQHCASKKGGGWWFNNGSNCTTAFLTGTMDTTDTGNFWHETFRDEIIKKIIMVLWVI